MAERAVAVTNETGLHARPAALFVQKATSFPCTVTVAKGGQEANAKSILSVLKLDVRRGDTVVIRCDGEGDHEALADLVEFVESL